MNRKLCPILVIANFIGNVGFEEPYCQREKCAWWYTRTGDCSIVVIAEGADGIAEASFADGALRVHQR